MESHQHRPAGLTASRLPLWIAAATFALFVFTINRWVSGLNLLTLVHAAGWEWLPPTTHPLNYVLTMPIRWLPAAWQPLALNLLAAACAAATLGLLARSVILLPHDRTREQRHAEPSERSLLSTPSAWLPPVLAVAAAALELTFWEHATAFSGEMLDLLLFAFCVWSLLEFRLDQRESRLTRLAFVYGLGVTNNYALVGFFPAFLVALVWMRGRSFFNGQFILRMLGAGIAGLLLFLLLPLVATAVDAPFSFWQVLRNMLREQWIMMFKTPVLRSRVAIMSLTSLLPLLFAGIRWPSSFGETSGTGEKLTRLAFHLVHGLFLVACLAVTFNPKLPGQQTGFSPRHLGFGLAFLPFYYLGALGIGYFSGYFLAVFHPRAQRTWGRRLILNQLGGQAAVGTVYAALVAVPVALVLMNLDSIRLANGPALRESARARTSKLPAAGGVVLADDGFSLRIVEAELRATGRDKDFVLADTGQLPYARYQERLAAQPNKRWPVPNTNNLPGLYFDSPRLIHTLAAVSRSNSIYYLHPSFGYYFEAFHPVPHGLVYELKPYGPGVAEPPPLDKTLISENIEVWKQLEPLLTEIAQHPDPRNATVSWLGREFSLGLNSWAVQVQRLGELDAAGKLFELALRLNADNPSAALNRDFNQSLRAGTGGGFQLAKNVEDRFVTQWDHAFRTGGPVDEPNILMRLGMVFVNNYQPRQAVINFQRAAQLNTNNLDPQFALIGTLIQGQLVEPALTKLTAIKNSGRKLSVAQQLEVIRLEARAMFAKGDLSAAEKLLRDNQARFPQDDSMLDALSQLYLFSSKFKEALGVIDEQLKLTPDSTRALLNKGAVAIQLKKYSLAIEPLNHALELQPENSAARMNRAIALLQTGELDAAKEDYTKLRQAMPNQFAVHYGLGEIAFRQKDFKAALEHYQAYLKLVPGKSDEAAAIRRRVEELQASAAK